MNKRLLGLLVFVSVISLLLAACQPAAPAAPAAPAEPAKPAEEAKPAEPAKPAEEAKPAEAAKPAEYKIGFSGPLTGDGAYYGEAEKEGIGLALDEINKAGGIGGVPLSVVYEDDRNNTADAQTVILKLAETDKVPLVIGINTSSVTMATCKKAEEMKVVQYSIGSNPKIGAACSDFTFQLQGNDLEQGLEFVKIAQFYKFTKVAIVYMNNDYGLGNKNAFVKSSKEVGIDVLVEVPLQPEGKDFRTEVLQVKSANPEMIAFVAYGAEGSAFLRQAKEQGLTGKLVGDANWGDESMFKLAGDALVGMVGLQAGAHTTPEYLAYAKEFQAKYNKPPSIWSEYFYDQIKMAAKAIEIGGYTGEGIRDATKKLTENFVGPSGPKKLDSENYVKWSFDWVEWQPDGKLAPVKK